MVTWLKTVGVCHRMGDMVTCGVKSRQKGAFMSLYGDMKGGVVTLGVIIGNMSPMSLYLYIFYIG